MVSGSPLVLGHGVDGGFEDGGEIRCGKSQKKSHKIWGKKTLCCFFCWENRSAGKQKSKNRGRSLPEGNTNKQKVEVEGGNAPTKCRHVLPPSRFEENSTTSRIPVSLAQMEPKITATMSFRCTVITIFIFVLIGAIVMIH